MAQGYFDLGDDAQAETEAKLLLARYPGSSERGDAQMLLAASVALQGRRTEAIALYQRIAALHPGSFAGRAHFEIGRLYEDSGEFEKAEASFAEALQSYPNPEVVALALRRVKRRVALRKPVDIHDHAAIFGPKPASHAEVATSVRTLPDAEAPGSLQSPKG